MLSLWERGSTLGGEEVWVVRWGGIVLGAASIVMLARYGFHFGFVAPLTVLLNYYESLLKLMFGWSEPYLTIALNHISNELSCRLHLYPHWKQVLVLMWLYVGADARMAWRHATRKDEFREPDYKFHAIFEALVGGLISAVCAIAMGLIPIGNGSNFIIGNALIVVIPALGLFVYENLREVGMYALTGRWSDFVERRLLFNRKIYLPELIFTCATVALMSALSLYYGEAPVVRAISSPGLALLAVLVLALPIKRYWRLLFTEGWGALNYNFPEMIMLQTFLGAFALLILNAGSGLAGL